MKQRKSLRKDKRAFTGLEAAIVLTAFIVVAAVFSYVVLNAGFFTSSKSKEVVHTGVEQVTSSIELSGDVIGHGWAYNASNGTAYYYPNTHDSTNLTVVELYLSLSAGQNPVDLNKMTVAYTDITTHNGNLTFTETNYTWDSDGTLNETGNVSQGDLTMAGWSYHTLNTPEAVHNNYLEPMEQARILITLPAYGVTANKEFHLELKPNVGAALTIPKRAPGQIDQTFSLN